ncbi:hypothetical protein [Limosilactobacillus secaliphilus]|nr:hypothetical protein [Limosilactobacillus secaliphilus]
MNAVFITIMTLVFVVESFWEYRLFVQLSAVLQEIGAKDDDEQRHVKSVLVMDRRWNWLSWILIIGILVVPTSQAMPFTCFLVLLETLMLMRLDRVKRRYVDQ